MSGQPFVMESDPSGLTPSAPVGCPSTEPKISRDKSQEEPPTLIAEDEETRQRNEVEDLEEEEVAGVALLEPSTLPWPAEKEGRPGVEVEIMAMAAEGEERDKEANGGSQDLSDGRSQPESDRKKDKWRESMPEGERWRDEEMDTGGGAKGGSLADDEEEEDEEGEGVNWMPEKAALVFTPHVNIVRPPSKELPIDMVSDTEDPEGEPQPESSTAVPYYSEWTGDDNYSYLCDKVCSDRLKLALGVAAAGVLFPLLVWLGYAFLPFDAPVLKGSPLRVVYTLRCSFFAAMPIMLGVVVQGVARLRFGVLTPLYESKLENRDVAVHWHYVNESLSLFLVYFLELAVMATYISQDLLKLVPLLTIIFGFGRMIYWLCLALGSSVRGLGFGFSFLPILVMLGVNFYYICTSLGEESVFDVAPPTTSPPPAPRWWG